MGEKVLRFNTGSSSTISQELNWDFHFARARIKEFSALGNPNRFMTSPTEMRRISYKKAAAHLRSWLAQPEDVDTKMYDELEAELKEDKIGFRED